MKKNMFLRVASVLLVLTLLSACAISGTFAKYTAEAKAEDSARVAKWSFKVDKTNIATSETFTFDLFKTIEDEAGGKEDDVAKAGEGETPIIAPGTSGKISLVLKNDSEVSANYAVTFSANEAGVPLEFSSDGTTWETDITKLNIAASDSTKLAYASGTATVTLQWRWAFTSTEEGWDDDKDNALGKAAAADVINAATPKITATITATQVN